MLSRSPSNGRAAAGRVHRPGDLRPFVEFFQDFTDRCHHGKEEGGLFPCLERCGLSREHGPIAVMLHEHQLGRAHVRQIAQALPAADTGDPAAAKTVVREGHAFIDLLRDHILKENHVLFEMADQVVGPAEQTQLSAAYADSDAEEANRRAWLARRTLPDELARHYGVAPRNAAPGTVPIFVAGGHRIGTAPFRPGESA